MISKIMSPYLQQASSYSQKDSFNVSLSELTPEKTSPSAQIFQVESL